MLTLRAIIPAPAKDVMHALTDAGAMRSWLAEHAESDQDRYQFWGRYTPEGDSPHQTLQHLDDTTLRFTWLLDGVETTVEIKLSESDDSPDDTVLDLSQTHWSFEEAISNANIRGVLQTYWCLSIANLADHIAGRPLNPKVDFTSASFGAEVTINADRSAVFDSLLDSAKVTEWFGYPIEIEPRVGGRFAMGGFANDPNPARIIDLVPDTKAVFDFGGDMGVTTWELADSGGATKLTFVQSGFNTDNPPYGAWCGWLSGVAELRRYHELPTWRPLWTDPS